MDPKKLRKQYVRLLPTLNKVRKHVHDQLCDLPSSDFLLETNLKPYTSIKSKMEKDEAKDPSELSDLVRGRIFYSEQFNADDLVDIIKKLFGKSIKKIDENSHRAPEHGLEYHGIVHVDLDIDGTKFELQLMPKEFKPYKEFLHQIYEKFRNPKTLNSLSDHQKEFLKKVHNDLYEKLDDHAKKNRSSNSD
jgi:hypothetical protein